MRLLLTIIALSLSSTAQTWTVTANPPISFNNVQLTPLTHTSYSLATSGPIIVTGIVANGSTVVYTLNRYPSGTIAGDSVRVSTAGILTPGNSVNAGLLTNSCTVTAIHTSAPSTITCASSTTATWTLTHPGVDQNATTLSVGGVLWQWYAEGNAPGPNIIDIGQLYLRTSSTADSVFPPVWNTPVLLPTLVAADCKNAGVDVGDLRIPLAGTMPNGDIVVFFVIYCYSPAVTPPNLGSTWYYHHDHTQAYNAGWTLSRLGVIPPGWTAPRFSCFQDSGRFNYDPSDGMPILTVGGSPTGPSTCISATPLWIKSTDNGVTWNFYKFVFGNPGTFEFTLINPSGNNWISFARTVGAALSGQFFPLYYSVSTDNGTTWTGYTNTTIPRSNICSAAYGQSTTSQYSVSPVAVCDVPAAGKCTLFYADRMGCSSLGATAQMAVVFDPAQVISTGAPYMITLNPSNLQYGIISSNLNGYEYVYFPTPTTFHLWWHGINSSNGSGADNLNIFQTNGNMLSSFVGSTMPSKSQVTGGTAWQ